MIRVEGYQNLYRDEKTGAIINCDTFEYDQHLKRLSHKDSQKRELDQIKNDIVELKVLMKEILNGLK